MELQRYLPLLLLALVFVVLIVLPGRQRKRAALQAQQMQESLEPGTPIMTTSGIHGTVAGKGEGTVDVEIAAGVVVTFARQAILEVRSSGAGPAGPDPSAVEGAAEVYPVDLEKPRDGDGGRSSDGTR